MSVPSASSTAGQPRADGSAPATPGRWVVVGALCVALAAFAAFANTLDNGFVQDDHYLIENNEDLKDLATWPSVFVSDFFATDDVEDDTPQIGYYRPVTRLSWMIDYALWGADAGGFHLTSVLVHALASLLITLLTWRLSRRAWAAILGGMVYAVHPAHAEAVNIITARSDVLAGLFVIATLYFFTLSRQTGGARAALARAAAFVTLACALGAKEVGMAGLLAVVGLELVDWRVGWFARRSLGARLGILSPFVALAVGYIAMRGYVINVVPLPNDLEAHGAWAWIYGVPVAFTHHLGSLLLPSNLRLAYGVHLPEDIDARWLIAMATVALVLLTSALAWWKRQGLLLLALGWFAAGIAPALALTKIHIPGGATSLPLADRWLYVPSLGLALFVAYAVVRLGPTRERLVAACMVPLLVVFFAMTWLRGPVFASDLTMMAETAHDYLADDPDTLDGGDARAYHALTSLGLLALREDRLDEAAELLARARDVAGGSARSTNNLASLELARGRPEAAIALLSEVLGRVGEREREAVFMNLAVALERVENFGESARAYHEVLLTNSDNVDAAIGAANALVRTGRHDEAVTVLSQAAERQTADHRVFFNLGNLCRADCQCASGAMTRYLAVSDDPEGHPRRRHAADTLRACGH